MISQWRGSASELPPSTTMTSSNPSATVRERVRPIQPGFIQDRDDDGDRHRRRMVAGLFSVGALQSIERARVCQAAFSVRRNMKYMTTKMVDQKTTCLCQNSTSP